jgi:tetratricopeptide (TPR) repeat protein
MIAALLETTSEVPAKPASARRWVWIPLVLALAAAAVPLVKVFRNSPAPRNAGARSGYLKAEDLLEHYYKPNAIDTAVSLLRTAVAEDPNSAANHAGLCRALWWHYRDKRDQSAVELARNECARALAINPEMASAHVTMGMIYTTTGRVELGEEELKKALELDSRSADAWSARAELYQKQGRTAEIEPAIQKAIDLKPDAWRYLNQLGVYYLGTGRNDAAVEQFRRAAQLNPDNARALNNLGLALSNMDRNEEAREAFEKSLRIDPQYATFENLGAVDWAGGKVADAAKAFEQATRINPASYIGWANLAAAEDQLPDQKGKAKETYLKAIELAEQARANAPSDPTIVSDLATYYASVGMREKCLPLLRQAPALGPDDPQVLYRVAQGYELVGQRGEALKWIAKALGKGLSRTTVERNPELASLRKDPAFPRP